VFDVVEFLKTDHKPKISIDFVSWRDGIGSDGFMVEQNISKNKYSAFIDEFSRQLTIWENGQRMDKITRNEEISLENYDIFFDEINNKISVGGKILTSKDFA